MTEENLVTQPEARRQARRLNELGDHPEGMVNIAGPVPLQSWGGQERGWTVYLVPTGAMTRR